jgi:diacylglycerol kinase family enzyme
MVSPVEVVINAGSGARNWQEKVAFCQHLQQIYQAAGIEAHIHLARSGREVVELARRAAHSEARAVVAGGGDGTINAVAAQLVGTDKVLGVLPLGTFNFFARRLNIPLDLEAAARNLVEGQLVAADVGEINGLLFLNNASLGLYPRILRQREQEYRRWGRSQLIAYLSVLRTLLRPLRPLTLQLKTAAGQSVARHTPLVFVCSNAYQLQEFNLPGSDCTAAGKLAFYITRPVSRWGMLRMALLTYLQRLKGERDLEVLCLEEAAIHSRRRRLNLAIDGEIHQVHTPLHVRFRRGALRVIAPLPAPIPDEVEAEIPVALTAEPEHAHAPALV